MAPTLEPLSAPNFGAGQVQGRKGVAQVIGSVPRQLRPLKYFGEHLIGREYMKKKATAKKPPEQKEAEKKKAFEPTYRG